MSQGKDCVIVGAGLVGLCAALHLQHKGLAVTLLDEQLPGQGASFGNAGFLATELVEPLGTLATLKAAPALLCKRHGPLAVPLANLGQSLPWMARFAAASLPSAAARSREALAALNRLALAAWRRTLTPHGLQSHLVQSGYLRFWESPAGAAAARQEARFLAGWDIHAEPVQGAALAELEPALAARACHGLYFADACRVSDPWWLSQALFEVFLKQGGTYRHDRVLRVQPRDAGVEVSLASSSGGASPGGESLVAQTALICAGASSTALLAPLGLQAPLMAERGYHLSLAGHTGVLNRPVCSAQRNVFINPLDSGLRIVGISELGGLELPPQPGRFETLRHHARALLPDMAGALEQASPWMGMRPTLPDSIPVIDCHPHHPRIGFAFGHQHLGLTQAAITGELISARLLGQTPALDLAPFSIRRFNTGY